MKKLFLLILLFIVSPIFSQTVNDYKAVIISRQFDFQKSENQYRLQTITKLNLQKAGFQSFYSGEPAATEFNNKCELLNVDVKEEKAFLVTKLFIVFKDCNGIIIYKSAVGKSKEKEFQSAYSGALNDAFKSVYALNYKYNTTSFTTKQVVIPERIVVFETPIPVIPISPEAIKVVDTEVVEAVILENTNLNLLYAQPTAYGYQLINNEPKVIMKVYKTSNLESYIATKGSLHGVLISKDKQWFFEYYQMDQLISEKINVKF
ncbi:hypothetical protein [Flavobacterium sp.]|uniref:hypothetical protein n=1 Tax=Flavobacterium sp. TaxID=239 RepID=UPI00286BD031|nr:hypothetical protein [Flavobacterium sp.]